jgi:hypothetical protein
MIVGRAVMFPFPGAGFPPSRNKVGLLKGQLQTYRAVTQRYCHKKRVTQRDRHIT